MSSNTQPIDSAAFRALAFVNVYYALNTMHWSVFTLSVHRNIPAKVKDFQTKWNRHGK